MSDYTAISSGATEASSHGCELWFRTSAPVEVGGSQCFLTSANFTAFHASPTLLVVCAHVGAL
eukprot:5069721-Lingulodinium_polyedra.AAC.1